VKFKVSFIEDGVIVVECYKRVHMQDVFKNVDGT